MTEVLIPRNVWVITTLFTSFKWSLNENNCCLDLFDSNQWMSPFMGTLIEAIDNPNHSPIRDAT